MVQHESQDRPRVLSRMPRHDGHDETIHGHNKPLQYPIEGPKFAVSARCFSKLYTRAIQVLTNLRQNEKYQGTPCQHIHLVTLVTERCTQWLRAQRKWCTLSRVIAAASCTDSLYSLLSAPLRMGFLYDPWHNAVHYDSWRLELVVFTVIDVTGSLVRLWNICLQSSLPMRLGLRQGGSPKSHSSHDFEQDHDNTNVRANRSIRWTTRSTRKRKSPSDSTFAWLVLSVYCMPWESLLLVVFRGHYPNMLHVLCLARLPSAYRNIGVHLAAALGGIPQKLAAGTVANATTLLLTGVYFCHVAASGYMFLAHWECGIDFTKCQDSSGCWLLRDRMEKSSQVRQYVRTLYWACKTIVTLGQSDVIPVTLAETGYRIVVQFFAGLWVTAILTAYTFYFTHKDANLTSNLSTRYAQTLEFLAARKAPKQLITSTNAYFQYMQRTRNGVEEDLILAALPLHYRTQCSHYIRYKAIAALPTFHGRKGAFLRTVMEALLFDVYAPGQTLLQREEPDEMFIVVCGEVQLKDSYGKCVGRILAGDAYAEYALFEHHLARHQLQAATHCEVWYLPTKPFKAALAKHFSRLVYASMLLQRIATTKVSIVDDPMPRRTSNERVDLVTLMQMRARRTKLFGHGSIMMQAAQVRKVRRAALAGTLGPSKTRSMPLPASQTELPRKVAPWRLPHSPFREQWSLVECILMLYLLIEVPYHVAFQRGFGLLNGVAGTTSDGITSRSLQVATFLLSFLVDLFFYMDLWLRARHFVRPYAQPLVKDQVLSSSTSSSDTQATSPQFATYSAEIFQLYLRYDNLLLEGIALAPVALLWDILPKEWFSRRSVHVLRCLRLLRLLRARNLRGKLHEVLARRGYGPAIRLLVDVVVFCTSTAHTAACVFFAVADRTSFEDGLPPQGVVPGAISLSTCLEDASLYDNCTWYMYDRSAFDINAPYLRSMLWSIVLLSTVGFGDIMAISTRECVVDALWIFCSANICYLTSCALSSVLAQLNVLSTIRHERIEGINVLLMSSSMATVSDTTKRIVRSYYEAKWKLNGSAVDDLELLEHLPRSLRRAISSQLYESDLRQCTLFHDDNEARTATANGDAALFMQQLMLLVTCEHFLRDVIVIKEGFFASDFFVVLSGELECLLPPVPLEDTRAPMKLFSASRAARQLVRLAASGAIKRTRDFTASTRLKDGRASLKPRRRSRVSIAPQSSLTTTSTLPSDASKVAVAAPVPISILKQHDYFGEESLSTIPKVYAVTIRVVSSARVAMIRRRDFLALAARFPHYVASLRAREVELRRKTSRLVRAHRTNFHGESNKKIVRTLGTCRSLYVDSSKSTLEKRGARVLDPTTPFARYWHRGIGLILVYNFYVIIFRLAFLPYPTAVTLAWLTAIDYTLDLVLFADLYLKFGHVGYIEFGEVVLDPQAIRRQYRASGRLWQDCVGMLPLYYRGDAFVMTVARLPRLLRCFQLGQLLEEVHKEIQERFLRGNAVLLSVFDLVKFFLIFVSTAHYIGSLYYLLGWLQLKTGLVTKSWVSVDLVLQQNPQSIVVPYLRAMYWCLSAFTVDCFGDILARTYLESCYELFTCVLGWVFVGQVIGRINALMVTLDKARKQRNDRVEDFEQYAKQQALPDHLWQRAMKGLTIKGNCQLELELHTTLRDLPAALHALVAAEMYGRLLQPLPEFAALSVAQVEAIARALVLEIYLPGDVICDANRVGTRLYLLKQGCAERVAPRTGIIYGALTDGALFGEFAFFLPHARRLFLVRAVRTCQVLQLHRRVWDRLWPPLVRTQVEKAVLPVITCKYRIATWGFLNIAKNFYIQDDTPVPPLGPMYRSAMTQVREKIRVKRGSTKFFRRATSIASLLPTALRAPATSFRWRFPVLDVSSASKREERVDASSSALVEPFKASIEMEVPPQPLVAWELPTDSCRLPRSTKSLARLSISSEKRWKRHEKRLRAIQLFHVDWMKVQEDLLSVSGVDGGRIQRRRVSICVVPSYDELRAAQGKEMKATIRTHMKRRHSIHLDPKSLKTSFTLSPAHVDILQERIAIGSTKTLKRPFRPTMLAQTVLPRAQVSPLRFVSRGMRPSNHRKVTPLHSTKTSDGLSLTSSPYSIWVVPHVRAARFDPSSRFRSVWASMMLIVTLYYLIAIPLQASFLDSVLNDVDNERHVMLCFGIEYCVAYVPCLVDFVLHRHYFVYVTSSGEVVVDPQRIKRRYWRHGWYLLDVMSMLPFEVLMFVLVMGLKQTDDVPLAAASSQWPLFYSPLGGLVNWHTFALLRLNRCLRVVHLRHLSDQVQRFLVYDRRVRGLTPGICYLVRLAIDFVLGTHWLSCLFYGVSYLMYDDDQVSWLTTPDMLAFGPNVRTLADIRQVPFVQAYLRTYHFSIGAITTVCYGDIVPMNASETLLTIAVIFISVAMFSMLSGGFYKYFDMALGRRVEYEEKIARVGHFVHFHGFPLDTWRHMQVYFAHSWRKSRGRQERELLRGLPPSIRQDLALHVHATLLKNVALFTRCEPAFAQAIIAALQHDFFVSNDVIIQRGDTERSLYIIESGNVLISAVRKRQRRQSAEVIQDLVDENEDDFEAMDEHIAPMVSEKEGVKASARSSSTWLPKATINPLTPVTRRQKNIVACMLPHGAAADIDTQIEREHKILKGPFDYFGERSLLFGTPRNATCTAIDVTSLYVLTSARFEAILDEFPHERSKSISAWVMTRT